MSEGFWGENCLNLKLQSLTDVSGFEKPLNQRPGKVGGENFFAGVDLLFFPANQFLPNDTTSRAGSDATFCSQFLDEKRVRVILAHDVRIFQERTT